MGPAIVAAMVALVKFNLVLRFRQWLCALLDLVLPVTCVACGAAGAALCPDCGASLVAPAVLAWPDPTPRGLPPPFAIASYVGPVRRALLAHKERRGLSLATPLGAALALAVAAAASARDGPIVIVPIPSRRAVVRRRGHDPTARLARAAARALGGSGRPVVVVAALTSARRVADSAGLSASERAANLAGALRARSRRELRNATVVLVDDVVTTGATLAEAARALHAVGVDVAGCAVVAATRRRRPGRWSGNADRGDNCGAGARDGVGRLA